MHADKLTLVKSDWLDDWYVIEKAEHDGREWFEPTGPNSMRLMCSSRVGDADVEGTAAEMLALADAIEHGKSESFKRCAATTNENGTVHLCSPRNSIDGYVASADAARALAAEIRRVLAAAPPQAVAEGGEGKA